MISEPTLGACPDLQTLSAYLDGKLDPAERVRIEDHISRCDECYFVVKETGLMAAAPGSGQASGVKRYLLPLAAMIILAVFAVALWRQVTPAPTYSAMVRPLVEAVGERRFFAPRLTGGFRYGPSLSSNRAAGTGPESEAWGVRAAAGELIARATTSPAGRAGRAAALLFTGEVDAAVGLYFELAQEQPTAAEWRSDLAAALLVRASRYGPDDTSRRDHDLGEALRSAERAVTMAPGLLEARFNLGLALKDLGRADEARRVFAEVEARRDDWSAAARDELRALSEPPEDLE